MEKRGLREALAKAIEAAYVPRRRTAKLAPPIPLAHLRTHAPAVPMRLRLFASGGSLRPQNRPSPRHGSDAA